MLDSQHELVELGISQDGICRSRSWNDSTFMTPESYFQAIGFKKKALKITQ